MFFSTLRSDKYCRYDKVLLVMLPAGNETSISANEHFYLISFVSSVFVKQFSNVVALVDDNANKTEAFSHLVDPLFVGCHSHRFNLAVKDFIDNHLELILRVKDFMRQLSYQIPAAKLCRLTHLRAKFNNETRWCSTYHMFQRYVYIEHHIHQL